MAQDLITYSPPQEKTMRSVFRIGFWLIGALVAIGAFIVIAPTGIMALNLLHMLFSSFISMGITGIIAAGVFIAGMDLLGKGGMSHKLIAQAYSSMINKLTWELLDIDPISPLTDSLSDMQHRLSTFEEAFAKFDGTIENLKQQENGFHAKANEANNRAKAAYARKDEDPKFAKAFQDLSYDKGSFEKAAAQFADMRLNLEPVRNTIKEVQEETEQVIHQLETDIEIARATWSAQQSVSTLEQSARGVLKGTDKQALAARAQGLINQKYAEKIGRLKNLSDSTQPLLMSIDLDKGAYSQALLDEWKQDAGQIEGPTAPLALAAPLTTGAQATGGFANLIH